jgi:2-keto-4-pentenoate hydratase/2-oxohepta-3-ene-1,7-dioic acid hydratase in catechol pathway
VSEKQSERWAAVQGNVLATGTVGGVEAFSDDPKAWYPKPGEIMECVIEKIGVQSNKVLSWKETYGSSPVALATQESQR